MNPDKPEKEGSASGEQTKREGKWPPELRDLQRRGGMSPDWHETVHGKGKGVGKVGTHRIHPPDFFEEVTKCLDFSPPNIPPSPPRIPTEPGPPPGTWNPEIDGQVTPESRGGFSPSEGPTPVPMDEGHSEEREKLRWMEPGPPHELSPDAVAYYHPWHIGGDDHWGIYFRRDHMEHYIERIEHLFGWSGMRAVVEEQIYWHEMEHFEQEKAATALEDLLGEVVYPTWLSKRYGIPVQLEDRETGTTEEVHMIEEALATAREIEWAKDRKETLPPDYADFIIWDAMSAPIGYRSFYLCLGEMSKQQARAAFLESVGSVDKGPPRQRLTGETAHRLFGTRTSSLREVPFTWVDH